jgi:hypothetical protein
MHNTCKPSHASIPCHTLGCLGPLQALAHPWHKVGGRAAAFREDWLHQGMLLLMQEGVGDPCRSPAQISTLSTPSVNTRYECCCVKPRPPQPCETPATMLYIGPWAFGCPM